MLPALEAERQTIEDEIGEPLSWNPNPENLDKIVVLHRDANLEDRESWGDRLEWMTEKVRRFRKAFGSRVKNINKPATTA